MTLSELAGSISLLQRANVLDACRDGPVDRTTIAGRADCSRSTVYRATDELCDQGLLEQADHGYRLTGAGNAMLDHVQRFIEKQEGTKQILPLFEFVDDPAFNRRTHLFTDAELITQDASSPYRIEKRMKEVIENTDEEMTGMTTGLGSPALAEAMIECIQGGVHVDWVLPTEMYEQFNAEYDELSAHAVDADQTVVSVREQIPIDLALYDETLAVFGFDRDRGVIGTVAMTDDRSAVQWAEKYFNDCRSKAMQVE